MDEPKSNGPLRGQDGGRLRRPLMALAARVAGGADVPNWVYLLLLLLNALTIVLSRLYPGAVPPPPLSP